eukprot:scaffold6339_cov112-Isochrysis_galbana.AAC.2
MRGPVRRRARRVARSPLARCAIGSGGTERRATCGAAWIVHLLVLQWPWSRAWSVGGYGTRRQFRPVRPPPRLCQTGAAPPPGPPPPWRETAAMREPHRHAGAWRSPLQPRDPPQVAVAWSHVVAPRPAPPRPAPTPAQARLAALSPHGSHPVPP